MSNIDGLQKAEGWRARIFVEANRYLRLCEFVLGEDADHCYVALTPFGHYVSKLLMLPTTFVSASEASSLAAAMSDTAGPRGSA
jgi:hypothetical protein